MISEEALAAVCRPAILGRARIISRREGRIWDRACCYEENLTHISARVDSASGYMDSYETSITFDETADVVQSFSCDCPAARKFSGPCKHSIALAIDFNRNGEQYEGFNQLQHVSTSTVISSFLDRSARMARPRITSGTGEAPATVRVVPRLMHDNDLFLGLRLVGTRGAYVVRDLGAFEGMVSSGAFYEYGKRLAFTHELGSFVEEDRDLVMFVCRCVRNRRSYAGNRVYGHVYATSGSALSVGKELRLSGPEADELLGLLMGRMVALECPASGALPTFSGLVEVAEGDGAAVMDEAELLERSAVQAGLGPRVRRGIAWRDPLGSVEHLAKRDRAGIDGDHAAASVLREGRDAVAVHGEPAAGHNARRERADLRDEQHVSHGKRRRVLRRQRERRVFDFGGKRLRADGRMGAVNEAQLAERGLHDVRARNAEDDVLRLREQHRAVEPFRRKALYLQLPAHRVLHKLQEDAAFALHKREDYLLRHVRARRPQRMEVCEARRVRDRQHMPLVVEEHREVQRVAGPNFGDAER